MQSVRTFNVSPRLPEVLEPLNDLARNLWWTWEPDARKLFRDLNPTLWDQTNHNPIRMLQLSKQGRLEEIASDEDYLRRMRHVHEQVGAGGLDLHGDVVLDHDVEEIGAGHALVAVGRDLPDLAHGPITPCRRRRAAVA